MRELERNRIDSAPLGAITIVGAGRLGRALDSALQGDGSEVWLAGRGEVAALTAGRDLVLLCVPDAAIAAVAEEVAGAMPPPRFVGHASGATPLAALAPAAAAGAEVFSLHPLQTVPEGTTSLAGAPCAIAADTESALGVARILAERAGMQPFEIAEERRAAYHAAACMASNFLITLEETAAELLRRTGIEDPRELLAPVVLRTAANWAEDGPAALTGPIARGDEPTVERHLEAIRDLAPELLATYEALAERTRGVAGDRRGVSA